MQHLYKVHDKVELNKMLFTARTSGPEVYEVVRLLPADVYGEVSYRIKSGVVERAVRESDIRRPVISPKSNEDVFRR